LRERAGHARAAEPLLELRDGRCAVERPQQRPSRVVRLLDPQVGAVRRLQDDDVAGALEQLARALDPRSFQGFRPSSGAAPTRREAGPARGSVSRAS
jgi:hypothetical protein